MCKSANEAYGKLDFMKRFDLDGERYGGGPALFERLEIRQMMSGTSSVSIPPVLVDAGGQAFASPVVAPTQQLATPVSSTQTTPPSSTSPSVAPNVTPSTTPSGPTLSTVAGYGFVIGGNQVHSVGYTFMLGNYWQCPDSISADGTLTYVYPGWTVNVSPTQDASGIHFAIQFMNTGSAPSAIPNFNLCDLSGMTNGYMWANNQTGPCVLDQTLADGSHFAVTVDDPTFPVVAVLVHDSNTFDGSDSIQFLPSGNAWYQNFNQQYDLGLVPLSVAPGTSSNFHCSLRFGPTLASVSAATNAGWAQAFPYSLQWTDRRQMLRGDMFSSDPSPSNPQGCNCGFDINNPANFQAFANFAMSYAATSIATCKALNAGTWIEWDLEGKQNTAYNYMGNPELIDALNPGWAQKDSSGVALIDRYFAAFKQAGINIGVCLRPWTLTANSNGTVSYDPSISGVQSIQNNINYCEKRWGLNVFYIDSPGQYQTAQYRAIAQSHPGMLMIPEDVPESWMQFSAPMIWLSGDVINWGTAPRNIYGNLGWGVYFHQDLTDPGIAASFLADAELGSTVLTDGGWEGPTLPQPRTAESLLAIAQQLPIVTSPVKANGNSGFTASLGVAAFNGYTTASDLTYQWAVVGLPPGPVYLTDNDTNTAQNTTAMFSQPGYYTFQVTITNSQGFSAADTVSLEVTGLMSMPILKTSGPLLTLKSITDPSLSGPGTILTGTTTVPEGSGEYDANRENQAPDESLDDTLSTLS